MKILLIFTREDPYIVTLRNAILKCGYVVKCCRTIDEIHESFKLSNYDLVFIDTRRNVSLPKLNSTINNQNIGGQYEPENICSFIRKLYQHIVIVAISHNFEDRDVPSILPLLNQGFNKIFTETTNLNRCINELLTLEFGEVANVKRLQAAHVLFTALEYANDSIEILNSHFNLLYANNSFEKLTGHSLNEVCGQNFSNVHRLGSSGNVLLENLQQGNVCESQMPFVKSNGETVYYSSYTIPVIVQGETNKIFNYINISNMNTSREQNNINKFKKITLTDETKKTTNNVFVKSEENIDAYVKSCLPSKRSYDFGKFAQLYGLETHSKDPLKKVLSNTSNYSTQVLATIHPSVSSTSSSSPYTDDEKLTSYNSFNVLNPITRSFPEFTNKDVNENLSIVRKRSYDVKTTKLTEPVPRRHSTARVINQVVETPIRKVIGIINLAHNQSTGSVKVSLEKALNILRSNELYSPVNFLENDIQTTSLVNGLMTNVVRKDSTKSLFNGKTPVFTCQPIKTKYTKNLSPEINRLLKTAESWSFDIISLERLSNKRPLVTLGMNIMKRFDVCEHLKIEEHTLLNWLTLIELNYKASNPYHNSTHASDVLHATAYFLSNDKISDILEDNDKVASLLAAAAHDLNHPGRTNAFLMNSNNDLAILYNDQAVLENHHAACAFQLTRAHEDANIFKNLNAEEYRQVRSVMIDMILATEMNKHFEHLNKFVNKFCHSQENAQEEFYKKVENRILIKRILIKCADVSNPARPLDIYKEWANRIASEYFEQTDEEINKGLPVVMPAFNRKSCNIPKSQISFIEYFVTEMFEAWDEFTDVPEVIGNLQANLLYWRECADAYDLSQLINKTEAPKRNQSIREDNENEISEEIK